MSEHDEQKALVSWFKLKYPEYFIIALTNGAMLAGNTASRSRQMNKLKAEGLVKGASDLFIAVPRNGKAGLFIEMKDKGKTLCHVKPEQKLFLEKVAAIGYAAHWCAGFDAAREVIEDYLKL